MRLSSGRSRAENSSFLPPGTGPKSGQSCQHISGDSPSVRVRPDLLFPSFSCRGSIVHVWTVACESENGLLGVARFSLPHENPRLGCHCLRGCVSAAAAPELLWETTCLVGPESVVFDSARNEFYVSNMGTHGKDATPGDGLVSRVGADGKLLELKWVTGFDNPKGLALVGGKLYVGDDKDLVEIDVAGGKVAQRYAPADGPGDFNDHRRTPTGTSMSAAAGSGHSPACTPASSMRGTSSTARRPAGSTASRPRRIACLGGWSVRDADGKEQLGHISFVTYADQQLGRLGSQPICHIDGLEPDGKGGYIVSDWLTGDVLQVSAAGGADANHTARAWHRRPDLSARNAAAGHSVDE